MRAAGLTVLMSTHDMEEAGALCDRIGILHEGRIVAAGSPSELVARSSAPPRVAVRTARMMGRAEASAIPGVVSSAVEGDTWILGSADVAGTVAALVRLLEQDGNTLLNLRIRGPSLEDVFMELTGRPLSGAAGEEGP
jgi:ABC-2 type transport system ATP-binding protein